MADMAQMIAAEVGLTCGFCKRKDDVPPMQTASANINTAVAGDGVQELLLANLGGHKWQP